jgi:hypothetical protein
MAIGMEEEFSVKRKKDQLQKALRAQKRLKYFIPKSNGDSARKKEI